MAWSALRLSLTTLLLAAGADAFGNESGNSTLVKANGSGNRTSQLKLRGSLPQSRWLADGLPTSANSTLAVMGWFPTDGHIGGSTNWCRVGVPDEDWSLRSQTCGTQELKLLSYNLYWWNLFGLRNGNGGSAGRLIAKAQEKSSFDFMGFQECEKVERVLEDAGLSSHYGTIDGGNAVAIAYQNTTWQLLSHGNEHVAEDRWMQWFGKRPGQWARFRHATTGRAVFVMNHHGPLPKNTGGLCGTRATAFNILRVIAEHAHADDAVVVLGDFNSDADTKTYRYLSHHLHAIYTGKAFGGVDHFFSSCKEGVRVRNLGGGGSDHDALEVVLQI